MEPQKKRTRGSVEVTSIVGKMRKNKLRWFSHVMRRENSEAVRTVMEMNVEGRGRSKKKWLDTIGCDMRTAGVCVDDMGDCVMWRFRTQVANSKQPR